jgi:hypothetical protein
MFSLFFRRFSQVNRPLSTYPVLGRWALNQTDSLIYRKIDLANEDHCGCCFQSEEKKQEEIDDLFVICEDDIVCISDK